MNTATGESVGGGSRAVLVAVEEYGTGSSWNLDGPVRDVLAYRAWLLEQGAAADSIKVLASPLPANRTLLEATGVHWRPADRERVHEVLFREVAPAADDWLFVAWAGHGLVDLDGKRRLVYADAAIPDLRCLDLDGALAAFRSDLAPQHTRQLWLIDACQTFTDVTTVGHALRPDPVPRGRLRQVLGQHVLFASGPGQVTTGVFSAAALELLRAHPEWRYDSAPLAAALRERFRRQGLAAAVPTTLWSEGGGAEIRTHAGRAAPRRRLEVADYERLLGALQAVPAMLDPGLRAVVISHLPLDICSSVPRNAVPRIEILRLISTCVAFRNGLWHLWKAVSLVDAGTVALDDLEAVLQDYPEWFTAE
ncbi:effector-associated domain 2-containing protein [Streptomyces longisporus]|uniref:Effector-associated domain-containing protein n=1 Tax=Streptomyces longisporus TaxID=1948 RepID=A0ABN3MCA3_STRLO